MIDIGSSLKILLVEDQPADAELVLRALVKLPNEIDHRRVSCEEELRDALSGFRPHIVLSDFSMPGFSGLDALEIVRHEVPTIPFIFVSGTIGEERAIEALQRGATDYVLKDNLKRLIPSVERALQLAAEREQRRQVEKALFESEARYRSVAETTQDWIWETDAEGLHTYSNSAVEGILGYPSVEMLGHAAADFWLSEDSAAIQARLLDRRSRGEGWRDWLVRLRHRNGSIRHLESSAHPLFNEQGTLSGFRGVSRDVTQRLAQSIKLRQLSRIHSVLSALGSAIIESGSRAEILDQVAALCTVHGGFASASIIERFGDDGRYAISRHHGLAEIGETTRQLLESQEHEQIGSLRQALEGGKIVYIRDAGAVQAAFPQLSAADAVNRRSIVLLPFGAEPCGFLVLHCYETHLFDSDEKALLERLSIDITRALDFIANTERIEFIARHNELTGFPNRQVFKEEIVRRAGDAPIVVALVGVSQLHRFQDTRGQTFSALLLRSIAQRLRHHFNPNVALAHLSESSFAIVFDSHTSLHDATIQIDGVLELCSAAAHVIQGDDVHVALNCGLLETGRHGSDPDAIERNAHSALTEAMRRQSRVVVYNDEFGEQARERFRLERDLRCALDGQQFELFLQPKFDARSEQLTGAEALLRWRHPSDGLIGPNRFIPMLEETGLILPVGRWVMEQALEIAAGWRLAGKQGLRIAINVSARELRGGAFLESAAAAAARWDLSDLDIEITEGQLMDDMTKTVALLKELRRLGCKIHIDDFGTGYSSLSYLSCLPVDVLKIDRSFVCGLASDSQAYAIANITITLAHSLGLRVIAEGVECEDQAKMLRLMRCDELQGYHLGRPVPVQEFNSRFLDHYSP